MMNQGKIISGNVFTREVKPNSKKIRMSVIIYLYFFVVSTRSVPVDTNNNFDWEHLVVLFCWFVLCHFFFFARIVYWLVGFLIVFRFSVNSRVLDDD
jgi:hypothetical protein